MNLFSYNLWDGLSGSVPGSLALHWDNWSHDIGLVLTLETEDSYSLSLFETFSLLSLWVITPGSPPIPLAI